MEDIDNMKISIVTVSYNSEKTIEQTIQSVIGQRYKNKEYIIIDGGSTDGTIDIIQRYSQQLSYWCSEPDEGIYDAMNKGLRHVTGDVVAFLNSDDWYEPDILQRVAGYFKDNEIDCLAGGVYLVLNDRIFEDDIRCHTEEDIHFFMIYRHPAFFCKKDVFSRIGAFNKKYKIAADYDFALRVHNAGYRIMETPEIFTNFRRDGLSAIQFYKGKREIKEIALGNIGEHEIGLRDEINRRINCDAAYEGTLTHIVCKENPAYVYTLLGNADALYIWGTGENSKWCLNFFLLAGIEVKGFVDTYKKQEQFKTYRVLLPEDLPRDAFVCISAERYYDEIVCQLQKMGFTSEQYTCFSEVSKRTLQYGKEFYADKVLK